MMADRVLFEATLGDVPVIVALADDDNLAPLVGTLVVTAPRDTLDLWSPVVIRNRVGDRVQVHVLAWARRQRDTCLTSSLVQMDLVNGAIATETGSTYLLGQRAGPEIGRELLDHLDYALRLWGFTDVRC